jgi:ArsR family transcriptional regulator, arsenate/arsenite/antimonite-responsive transcriptional repressor
VPTELNVIVAGECCQLATTTMDEAAADRIAGMFRALGDPVRLRLAAMIAAKDEICVCELTPHFALSGPTISHHLKVLREAGLVDCERRGTWVHYWIKPEALQSLSTLLKAPAQR